MHLMQLLNSLDELLYAIMSWLIFYPLTLWRTLRSPASMMRYADRELADDVEDRYADTVSPPLFLLLSVLLSHGIELALIGDSPLIRNQRGLSVLVSDDTSLIMMRMIFFGFFPLIMATRLVRLRGASLSHQSLKQPFYAQCYVTAPFALLNGLAATLVQYHQWQWAKELALALVVVAFLWYLTVQARWFADSLGTSLAKGVLHAIVATVGALLIIILMTPVFA